MKTHLKLAPFGTDPFYFFYKEIYNLKESTTKKAVNQLNGLTAFLVTVAKTTCHKMSQNEKTRNSDFSKLLKNGRDERIRTSDPLDPIQVRYQTALHPDLNYKFYLSDDWLTFQYFFKIV